MTLCKHRLGGTHWMKKKDKRALGILHELHWPCMHACTNVFKTISIFETRLRIYIIKSRASRRERERELPSLCLILRDKNENFTAGFKKRSRISVIISWDSSRDREDVQAIYKFLPTSLHRDMLFYPYLRWANALVWLVKSFKSNVFPKLQAISGSL